VDYPCYVSVAFAFGLWNPSVGSFLVFHTKDHLVSNNFICLFCFSCEQGAYLYLF
jgi:hypothetical protein